jgi:hypothetical protein
MKNINKKRLCNYLCAFMCLLVLITQFMPFWTCSKCKEHKEADKVVSIAEYTWLPDHHSPITKGMTAVYKEAYGADYTRENGKKFTFELNDIITPLLIIMIGSIAGVVLGLVFSNKAIVSLITAIVGGVGIYWYSTCPAMKVGANWEVHLIIAGAALVVAIAVMVYNIVVAVKKYF